jgi:ubiquinol-cytochrome c reductase iron-sulfur subunit
MPAEQHANPDLSLLRDELPRRDFLYIATGAAAAVGTGFSLWPFVDQMNPSADVLASGAPVNVDLSKLEPGQQIVVIWRGHPVFVVNRSQKILAELKSPALLARLRDPGSASHQQPGYAENWSRALKPEYLVVVGVCTHLGCIPSFMPDPGSLSAGWPGGYFCPCHGSKYDLAGRVFKGVPAPFNLPVPPYRFEGDTMLVIGENPEGTHYSLSDVEQI